MGILRSDRITGLGGANAITGSVFFPQNSYINVEPDSDLDLSGDFTVEMWVYNFAGPTIATYQRQISSKGYYTAGNDGNWYFGFNQNSSHNIIFYSYDGTGSAESLSATCTSNLDEWYHIAASRSGSTLKLFVNGVEEASGTLSKGLDDGGNNGLFIGGISSTLGTDSYGDHYGYISNIRIIKGRALYIAAFTPPAFELNQTSDTVFLGLQSSGNVLQEKTGKILSIDNHYGNTNSQGVISTRFTPNSPVGFSTTTDVGSQYGATFDGFTVFATSTYMVPPGGNTRERNRGLALFGGGETPSKVNSIEFVNVQSMGIAKNFGDFTSTSGDVKALGSSTRGVFRTNYSPSSRDTLEFITFAAASNSIDFGDLVISVGQRPGASNQTRGIFSGGLFPGSTTHNEMDLITIATAGNATDFGNLSVSRADTSALASSTRMIVGGGYTPSTNYGNVMDFVTIATTGNAADFGDLNTGKRAGTAVASSTRGIFGPGKAPSVSDVIDFVTIATTGNATDFGDALVARGGASAASNSIRGLFAGGYSPSLINGIEFITIATTGDGADFGDMTFVSQYSGGCSDSHGGL